MQLDLQNVAKSYGGDLIFHGVNAKIEDRDRIGLVGANGAGKTTLLNIICGQIEPDEGEVLRGSGLSIGYQRQNSGLVLGSSIIEEMRSVFADVFDLEQRLHRTAEQMAATPEDAALAEQYRCLEDAFLARDGYQVPVKINTVLTGMGFADHGFDKRIDLLSGGEQTRLAIAKLLLEEPSLLILDEPTNHLDFETLEWLEGYLTDYRGAVLVVSHDRYFLDRICSRIWEIDGGELSAYHGNYSRYIALREEQDTRAKKLYEEQRAQAEKLEEYIAKNLVRASTTKMAQSRRKALEKMEPAAKPKPKLKPPRLKLECDADPVKDVLDVENLELAVGEGKDRRVLVPEVNFHVARGEKIAVIGANGTGKTTLLKYLMGIYPPTGARITWGRGVKSACYDQGSDHLDGNLTVLDTMWSYYPRSYETPLRSMLGAMGLTGEDAFKKVAQLSGGEKARLKMAIICLSRANVLILDEPTNHLDLITKEALEKALCEYTGTVILISHDRYLLNRVPDRILEIRGGRLNEYQGRYDDYLELRAKEADTPQAGKTGKKPSEQAQAYNKGKEQRRQEAKRRKEYAQTELLIARLEQEIESIRQQLQDPQTASDYQLLQELCMQSEQKQRELNEAMERWIELSEE